MIIIITQINVNNNDCIYFSVEVMYAHCACIMYEYIHRRRYLCILEYSHFVLFIHFILGKWRRIKRLHTSAVKMLTHQSTTKHLVSSFVLLHLCAHIPYSHKSIDVSVIWKRRMENQRKMNVFERTIYNSRVDCILHNNNNNTYMTQTDNIFHWIHSPSCIVLQTNSAFGCCYYTLNVQR